ncbi:hypothetical protein ATANTOWER_015676 [Ataeniobius toweri]|uniref:Uncharacterized protein n=1 Tax=Ataeniobius toweri TaxID=208326 RepID=A0ABU7BTW2_9TELE|nr:hypothetical protein [Ataeniobius toweri]
MQLWSCRLQTLSGEEEKLPLENFSSQGALVPVQGESCHRHPLSFFRMNWQKTAARNPTWQYLLCRSPSLRTSQTGNHYFQKSTSTDFYYNVSGTVF